MRQVQRRGSTTESSPFSLKFQLQQWEWLAHSAKVWHTLGQHQLYFRHRESNPIRAEAGLATQARLLLVLPLPPPQTALRCPTTTNNPSSNTMENLLTCSAATNWTVLTSASLAPTLKLKRSVSTKCAVSILMSTKTYSIFTPFVESMGTVGERGKDSLLLQTIHIKLQESNTGWREGSYFLNNFRTKEQPLKWSDKRKIALYQAHN